jgi:hypothetical protein
MSERHMHRPATFKRTILVMGVIWYVYICECGLELPERRAPVAGIAR